MIKPSGVAYHESGRYGSGRYERQRYRPDTTHLELYRRYPSRPYPLHSCHRMGAGAGDPALGTTHADYFFGDIPCTRGLSEEEVQGEYELNTGKVIIETLGDAEPLHTPGIVVYQHGPFAGERCPRCGA